MLLATQPADDIALTIVEAKGRTNWAWDGVGVFLTPRQFAAAVDASESLKREFPTVDWSGVPERNGKRQLRRTLGDIEGQGPKTPSGA
jgi:hypothetical protein